ncbi:aminotransferase [Streptomyces scabiei]|uniref:Aminotransferase n=1 Tax=Streptomyces scabiei TaxID=1930 RepID=A0A100JWL8_STRSC|nr:aminotransferase [Streptomyces scabiei]
MREHGVGWVTAAPELVTAVRSAKQYLTYVASGPFQYAVASLPERAGVVAIPNAVFYDHREAGAPFVRFAFCKRTEVLTDAAERLRKAFAG